MVDHGSWQLSVINNTQLSTYYSEETYIYKITSLQKPYLASFEDVLEIKVAEELVYELPEIINPDYDSVSVVFALGKSSLFAKVQNTNELNIKPDD